MLFTLFLLLLKFRSLKVLKGPCPLLLSIQLQVISEMVVLLFEITHIGTIYFY